MMLYAYFPPPASGVRIQTYPLTDEQAHQRIGSWVVQMGYSTRAAFLATPNGGRPVRVAWVVNDDTGRVIAVAADSE